MKKTTKEVAALMLMIALFCVAGCTKSDGSNNGNGNNDDIDGHEYVNLGLPSGTMWATCNVGASTPEGYGEYFAWGETQPKSVYDWNNYKYGNAIGSFNLTKYCNNEYNGANGFTDNLVTLQPSDDAATVNWGSSWHTPTREQFQELSDNTTHTWTTQNGVNGCLFTANNGQSIFLPAAGFYWENDDDLMDGGFYGDYWLSSLYSDNCICSWLFDFASDDYQISFDSRNRGRSVRPVCSAK